MKKNTLSVILPVYNTGVILFKTVKSILDQDYKNFELLLIDDGSTDGITSGICDKLASSDPRMKVFHKENEGIEITKVFGIGKSMGKYIVFSDHDDYYHKKSFTTLVNKAESSGADIVAGNYYEQLFRVLPIRYKGFHLKINEDLLVAHKEFMDNYYINFFGVNLFNVSTWGKIYNSNMLKMMDFKILGYNATEDVALNLQIFPHAKTVLFINDFLYTHIRGGITSVSNPDKILQNYSDLYHLKMEFIKKYNFDKAIPFINYEMKNILKHFVQLQIESKKTMNEIAADLKNYKKDEVCLDLLKFYNEQQINDDFIAHYAADDYKLIYQNAYAESRKNSLKRCIKKILTT